jgi:hypothetical protein
MHEESLIPNPLGIPADSNQLGNPLVPLLDLKFLNEVAAGAVGTSNRRH